MIWGRAKQSKYFHRCIDKNEGDCKIFGNFIAWIEITMNFGKWRICWTLSYCLDSSNSDHSRTTFLLIASYFHVYLCVILLLVQTLKKDKNTHSKEKMEICYNLGWKYGTLLIVDGLPISIGCLYYTSLANCSEKYCK